MAQPRDCKERGMAGASEQAGERQERRVGEPSGRKVRFIPSAVQVFGQ